MLWARVSQKLIVGQHGITIWLTLPPEGSRQNDHRSLGPFGGKLQRNWLNIVGFMVWFSKFSWKSLTSIRLSRVRFFRRQNPANLGNSTRLFSRLNIKSPLHCVWSLARWWVTWFTNGGRAPESFFFNGVGRFSGSLSLSCLLIFRWQWGYRGQFFMAPNGFHLLRFFPVDQMPTWGRHARWFQLLLKNYWKVNKLHLAVKSGPPESAVLQCWMVNVRLLWDSKRLRLVDEAMRNQLDGCIRFGNQIHQLAHFPRHSEMGVLR